MRHILFLLFMALTLQAIAQYPATGNKMRLGWQTTGDGLVYRGAIGDTATLDPSGLNNAWMLLDTANGNLYAYWIKAWRLVSGGGGGGGVTMPFDSVTFNINEDDASERELKYSEEKGYLQYGGLDSVQIPLLPGIWYVRNDTSVTIPKGTVVRATGTLGASGRIKVKHMIANGTIDAMYVLGIAMQDIAVGADGYVMTQGKIRQVNTQAYSEGAVLYADTGTLGGLTQTEPTGSNLKLPIAFVVHSASNGTLAVRVSPGTYLRDLHDAYITSPESNASLYYNASESVWRDTGAAVLVADTAAMLSSYISNADTATMLSSYISNADTATMLSSYISNADTAVFARDFQISGTANYLAKFTGSNTVGNSVAFETGRNLYINSAQGNTSNALNNSFEFNGYGSAALDQPFLAVIGNVGVADYRPRLAMYRTKGTTVNDRTLVPFNHHLGSIMWNAADGVDMLSTGAEITAITDNTTGENDMPTALTFATTADGAASTTERMRITSAGNVGINTTNPVYRLHVDGEAGIELFSNTTNGRVLNFRPSLPASKYIQSISAEDLASVGAATGLSINANGGIAFSTNSSTSLNERMRITNTGNVGIGTASPAYPLHVNGDVNTTGMYKKSGTDIISGTTNRLAMFTGSNTVGNSVMSQNSDTILNVVAPNASVSTSRFVAWYQNTPNYFTGYPFGTRYYSMLHGSSFASFSFGGTASNNAHLQLTSWTGSGSNFYSSRLVNNSTGDLGFYLSPLASDANPTMSATPHLMILNGGNVGIATSSPSRPLHVNANSSMIIPSGATGTRPASGANGDIRYNTTNANFEWYSSAGWREPVNAARSPAAGLANRFSKFNTDGLLDTSAVLVQNGSNIGIGTTSASVALQVVGDISASRSVSAGFVNTPIPFTTDRPSWGMYRVPNNIGGTSGAQIGFTANSVLAMRINASGNVSIGLDSTVFGNGRLNVQGASGQTGVAIKSDYPQLFIEPLSDGNNSLAYNAIQFKNHSNTNFHGTFMEIKRSRGTASAQIATQNGDALFAFEASGNTGGNELFQKAVSLKGNQDGAISSGAVPGRWDFITTNSAGIHTERMTIRASGNVGIGTTSPTALLHLAAGTATANTAPLKFTSGTNLTTPEAGAVEWNGTNVFVTNSSATRQTVNQGLTNSATMDFPNTDAQKSSDLNITVTGASDGDVVSLGVPNAAVNANTCYTAWVSAANTVTIRFNNYSSIAVNPAQGNFKVFVTKF